MRSEEHRVGSRRLARLVEPIHSISYYAPEIRELTDRSRDDWRGYRGWWQAYFAYRAAPMGAVTAPVVTATFYNFAPRMVERSIPGVWDMATPAETIERRDQLVARALARTFGRGADPAGARDVLAEAAELGRRALADVDGGARPLFSAHAGLPWPSDDQPDRVVWHVCTLLRELRGDSHALALTEAGVDGCMSHLLMTARGTGNKATIQKIRGWNDDEWAAAHDELAARGWVDDDGAFTEVGRDARVRIERETDHLSAAPAAALTSADLDRLCELLTELTGRVLAIGEVPGTWPPPDLSVVDAG